MTTAIKSRRVRKTENTAEIRVRLSAATKSKAERFFKQHGLSTSDGVQRLLDLAIEDEDPWIASKMSSHIPNAETEEVLRDSLTGRNMEAVTREEFHRFLDEA
jgi:antitoxin component of RelBE/YafQ-DinJ toxin-antitoxin module